MLNKLIKLFKPEPIILTPLQFSKECSEEKNSYYIKVRCKSDLVLLKKSLSLIEEHSVVNDFSFTFTTTNVYGKCTPLAFRDCSKKTLKIYPTLDGNRLKEDVGYTMSIPIKVRNELCMDIVIGVPLSAGDKFIEKFENVLNDN